MKKNLPVTDHETKISRGVEVISSTDTQGIITHANDRFTQVSGFPLDELVGVSHNVVRHPDMPPAVFNDLWDCLKAGQCRLGIVKNCCKNGDCYWADAVVTPSMEGDRVVGYESVRVTPEAFGVARNAGQASQATELTHARAIAGHSAIETAKSPSIATSRTGDFGSRTGGTIGLACKLHQYPG